ncbi:RNA polymerase sigma factor [Cohnella sp. REN36]|uniref:RNA polymerase sigma factor n=1 Tax=Cohnella sp. REN36 TaxID=2887347 RepID=UPI001D14E6A8|nr:sigma-70 family RNA polymerase sigma factor [Cohnella sp. REN36]MCC3372267.1 sigma-70 family RNA polymerase sigma factor [Cohnella sp. REN36]
MENISDMELMRRVMQKNRSALEQLYERYVKLVYSFALRSTRKEHAAREVVQLVFTRLWTTEKYDPNKGRFVNWMLTLTRNITIDYMRKERRHGKSVSMDPEQWEQIADTSINDPGRIVTMELLRERIRGAYRFLSESQAELIEQMYWQGYTLSEISEVNHEPLGTIKSRLHKSLKILRKHLQEWGEDEHAE